MLVQEPRRAVRVVMRLGQPQVQPLDERGIAEGLGVLAQVVGDDGQHVEPLVELEAEGLVVDATVHDRDDVVGGGHAPRIAVVAAQAGAAANPQQAEALDELEARGVELAADAVALERRIDDRLGPVERARPRARS